MIINRPYWKNLIEEAWKEKNVIWLMGVRRVGKTSLCLSIDGIKYFDCEKPRTRHLMTDDPEGFLENQKGNRIVLDEIHRLDNPSEILKIAADHYPDVKIIATGSSTLGAGSKFKDTLTGRKRQIWLTPMLLEERKLFGNEDLLHRFLFGGFPSFFVKDELPENNYSDWVQSYWAKDIEEFFRVGKKTAFQKFFELLMIKSGGMYEATKYAIPCEVTRLTLTGYLNVLEETFVVHVIRPYATNKQTEMVSAPKVYGMDTGFINYALGRTELRPEDLGFMWEHCILNELHGCLQFQKIHYWRNKRGNEIDFVIQNKKKKKLIAIECKYNSNAGNTLPRDIEKNFEAFRAEHPDGENYVVSNNIDIPFKKQHQDLTILFVNPKDLIVLLKE
jgi:predicted AAA+ superfamily ATPase